MWICVIGMPGSAADPVCSVSVSGLWGRRHRGRLWRVPHHPARQHHAHGPAAWADMETTVGMFWPKKPNPIYYIYICIYSCDLSLITQGSIMPKSQDHNKPRTGRDIARVTFDLYRMSPKDVFGSLSVKATFQGLYSVSANFQCLGPKKVLR